MYSSVLHAQDVQCSRVFFNKRLFTYSIQPLFPGYNYCVILFDWKSIETYFVSVFPFPFLTQEAHIFLVRSRLGKCTFYLFCSKFETFQCTSVQKNSSSIFFIFCKRLIVIDEPQSTNSSLYPNFIKYKSWRNFC